MKSAPKTKAATHATPRAKPPRKARPARGASTLAEQAYQALEELIVTLAIEPGALLSEFELARRLGLGRTPIREALQRLAREGLIVILPRRGIVVSAIDVETQLKVIEVRRALERLMAELACGRAREDERAAFAAIADGMAQIARSKDHLAFMRTDRALNDLLVKSCGNAFITRSMGLMSGLSRRFWYLHARTLGDLARAATLHGQLAAAIAKRDVKAAAAASDALMAYIESFTRAAQQAR